MVRWYRLGEFQLINRYTLSYNFLKLFGSSLTIHNDFSNIWKSIVENVRETDQSVREAKKALQGLVLYDILDGSRSCLTSNFFIKHQDEIPLFTLALIHILRTLGAESCVFMVHTSYNRLRGEKEFNRIIRNIKSGSEIIKNYSINYEIKCNCLCTNDNFELINILKNIEQETQKGSFNVYFLFDYNEKWFDNEKGSKILDSLPEIDVHIRHTKFQPSGGWIPEKMKKSAFLYSQNGSLFSNWKTDELVALVALSLLAKKFNEGEGLSKAYSSNDEVQSRYAKRELDLFQKTVFLREHPAKKLFMLGSPDGVYQFYY